MSAFRWTLGTFLISACFFFGATAQAEDEPMGPFDGVDFNYSSLGVEDTRLDVVEGNPDLVLSAKLKNTGTDTRTFRASVEFRGASDANEDELVRVNGLESYTLQAGEEESIAFSVARPRALSGDYRTMLVIGDEKGNIVASHLLNEQRLMISEKVTVTGCVFGPSDGDTGVMVPEESENAVIAVACELALSNGNLENVNVVNRVVDSRTSLPMVLSDATVPLSKVATPVRYTVPVSVEPGQYLFEVVAVNATGDEVSIPVRTPLRVYGHGGRIVGLTELKKSDTASMLPVGAALELYDDASYMLSLSLQSGDVVCAEPVTVEVQNTNLKDATLSVTKNCPNPVLSATLLMDGSTVVDQGEKTMNPITGVVTPMIETSFLDNVLPKLPWIIVAILGALAGYFIWQKERLRRMAPVWVLALVSVSFGFSVNQVSAASTGFTLFCSDAVQTCPPDGTVWYNFQTNKDVYAPGEVIRITLSISSDDHPVPANNLCPVVQMRINSGSNGPDLVPGCYSANQFTAGIDLPLTQTAPMATGAFTIGVTVGQNGYMSPASRTMSGLSVAAAPAPTASLNISPTVATNPTVITFTLSSTNAQSCEVIETNQPLTYIDKSQNITGTTVQNAPAPGSYRFQTRCWSGTNGTGTVSSTDTDNLTINTPAPQPTATFTSLPGCSIPDGRSGCNTTVFWTSSNVSTVVLTNCTDVQLTAKGPGPQSFSPVYVPYNSGCYRLHDGTRTGTVLAQGNVSATCSGQAWQPSTNTCGNVNAICGTADGTVQNDIFDLSGTQICRAGDFSTSDSYLSSDSISPDKKSFTAGSSNANYLGVAWLCDGLGNGYDQWCRAYKTPLCGSANGKSFSSPPVDPTSGLKQALCQVGTPTSVTTNASNYTWQCNNTGSSPVSCSATRTGGAPTVQITARVVQYASADHSFWKKIMAFVIGSDHVAQATGSPATISTTGTANITWTSTGANFCQVSGKSYSSTALSSNANLSGASLGQGTWTYTLDCSGPGGSASDTVNVIVQDAGGGAPSGPPGDGGGFFNATPAACGTGTINLSWNSVSGATSYQLRDGSTQIYSGASTSYSHTGLVAGSAHSYTVRATNANGSSAWSSVRNANAPGTCSGPTATLSASPANIAAPGNPSTLTWTTSSSVTSCWATGGTDGTWNNTWKNERGGTQVVTPSVTTTYTLECWDAGGTSTGIKRATVTIGSGFVCTGSMSNHATVYSGDSSGLSANTPYSYSATNTAPKCQYSCDAGYTWDGSECAGPSVSLTANPTTIASGNSSILTWTPSSGVTSCWATNGTSPWTNSSRSASGGTQVVSPTTTTTYSIECWNATGISTGIRNRTITVTGGGPAAAVNLCPGSATMGVGSTQQFTAYYTASGITWNGCSAPNGTNVTGSATWSSTNTAVATINNGGSKGLATGVAAGSATMSAVYSGLTGTAGVTISCTPTNSCSSAGSQTKAAGICAGDTFNINDGCGGTLTCSGSRVCDYNWKEVAP